MKKTNMLNIKITTFKHGLFWYSCCEVPSGETGDTLYYDNTPTVIIHGPVILHTRGLTHYQAINKLLDELNTYYMERKGEKQ